jgi:hypothetical protein
MADGGAAGRRHSELIGGVDDSDFDPNQGGSKRAALAGRGVVPAADLDQGAAGCSGQTCLMWKPAAHAPFGCDLELAVIDADGQHALVFPCQRIQDGWINASTKERLDVRPTHWRPWGDKR